MPSLLAMCSVTSHSCKFRTHVIFQGSITKLTCEDVEYASATPTLFAVRIVCVMIWKHSSKSILQIVRSWPWVTRCYYHCWRRYEYFRLFEGKEGVFDCRERHAGRRDTASLDYICQHSGRRRQQDDGRQVLLGPSDIQLP